MLHALIFVSGLSCRPHGCVVYIIILYKRPTRFSATPWGVSCSTGVYIHPSGRPAGRGAYRPRQPSPGALIGPICPPVMESGHIPHIPRHIDHRLPQNGRLNATKSSFCCVRHFPASFPRGSPSPNDTWSLLGPDGPSLAARYVYPSP